MNDLVPIKKFPFEKNKCNGPLMNKLKLVGILAAVVLIGGAISIPLINNYTAYKVERALCEKTPWKARILVENQNK